MTTATATATASAPAELEYLCPTHLIRLTHLLAGGAGHCSKCGLFMQSLNHPMPVLDPEFAARRETAMASERKAQTNAKAKARREKAKEQRSTSAA